MALKQAKASGSEQPAAYRGGRIPRRPENQTLQESESRGVKEARILVQRIEWAHRRLERAKKLIEEGLLQVAQTTEGPLYLCRSQSRDGQEKLYVIEREDCPCEDDFYMEGRKLCKHVLARLLLESGIPLSEIGKNPIYWESKGEEQDPRTRRRSTDGKRSQKGARTSRSSRKRGDQASNPSQGEGSSPQ